MRIVHVLTRFLRAGSEENTALTCNAQAAAGDAVWVVYGRECDPVALALLDPRVRQICVPSLVAQAHAVLDVTALVALTRLFRELEADVVHTHQSKAGAIGRLAARLAGVRHIVHGVHILPFMSLKGLEAATYRWIEKLAGGFTDAFIHVSPVLHDACLDAGVGRADRHFVAPSGMDIAAFRQAGMPEDAEALSAPLPGRDARPMLVLMVASLERRKRHAPFLDVFRTVVDRNPDVRLLLAGAGEEDAALRERVEALDLGHHVRLLGLRSDVPALIRLADVGVLASAHEGLPRSVIQYALGGLPIVAPALPGVDAIVQDGRNGFVAPLDDLGGMVEPLVRLLTDGRLRQRMSAASAALDLSDWAGERMCARIETVYQLIGARAVRDRLAVLPELPPAEALRAAKRRAPLTSASRDAAAASPYSA